MSLIKSILNNLWELQSIKIVDRAENIYGLNHAERTRVFKNKITGEIRTIVD